MLVYGHEQCALELLKAGAAVDATNSNGWTALMLAAHNNHNQCLRVLLEAGASIKTGSLDVRNECVHILQAENAARELLDEENREAERKKAKKKKKERKKDTKKTKLYARTMWNCLSRDVVALITLCR